MMNEKQVEALELAREALEIANSCVDGYYMGKGRTQLPEVEKAIAAIDEALMSVSDGAHAPEVWEQPAQVDPCIDGSCSCCWTHLDEQPAQPSKPWVGLTDEEKSDLWCESTGRDCVNEDTHVFADAIEAKLRELNEHREKNA